MASLVRNLSGLVARLALVIMPLTSMTLACEDSSPIGPSNELISVILGPKCSVVVVGGVSCTATARAFGPNGELSSPALFWRSSDPGIFSVTGSGTEATVTARAPGSATLSVRNRSGTVSAENQVTVVPQCPTVVVASISC
jgi:hypothetical protein